MRLRLLAFVPFAMLMSWGSLVFAASIVSALESKFLPDSNPVFLIERFESRCDVLTRRIETISQEATTCKEDIQCLRSPILCPIVMDSKLELEYQLLSAERIENCEGHSLVRKVDVKLGKFGWGHCQSTEGWSRTPTRARSESPAIFVF